MAAELVLVVGDMHIPTRASQVPLKIQQILTPGKVQQVLCTGNLVGSEAAEYLAAIASKGVVTVRGDFDENPSLPETAVVKVGAFKLGVCHGHQFPVGEPEAAAALLRKLDVDVLISGHTHTSSILEYEGRCLLNPGSITGAYTASAGLGETNPSFLLLSIPTSTAPGTPQKMDIFSYELRGEDLKVTRRQFTRRAAASASSSSTAAGSS